MSEIGVIGSDRPPKRMLPPLDDATREFWTGGASGELRLPRCVACRLWVLPPALDCAACGGQTAYEAVSGRGTVFAATVNHHPFNPEVAVPYSIAIVELVEQEGLRFTTNVVGCRPEDVSIGMPVRVRFEQQRDVFLPLFQPEG